MRIEPAEHVVRSEHAARVVRSEHAPHNVMDDPDEIVRFYDRCSVLMRELLDGLAASPDRPRPFPAIEDAIGWPHRRIACFYDRCSVLMRELLDGLAASPDRPRPFPAIEDAIGWPRRRIASVLGGVCRLRQREFGGRRPYHFLDDRHAASRRWEMWMDADQAEAVRSADRLDAQAV